MNRRHDDDDDDKVIWWLIAGAFFAVLVLGTCGKAKAETYVTGGEGQFESSRELPACPPGSTCIDDRGDVALDLADYCGEPAPTTAWETARGVLALSLLVVLGFVVGYRFGHDRSERDWLDRETRKYQARVLRLGE